MIGRNGAGKSSFLKSSPACKNSTTGRLLFKTISKSFMCRRSPFLIRTQPYLILLPKVWAKFAIYCAVSSCQP
ncbi:hypothetical protein ACFFKZ_12340 [Neisseria gonorrhoeae]